MEQTKLTKMTNFLLKKMGLTPLTGDVMSIHKGSLSVLPKGRPSNLKAALKLAIKSKELDIKLKLLPDVSYFTVKSSVINPLLLAHGLDTKCGSTKMLVKGRNRSINRYIMFQLKRMHQAKVNSNPQLYWVIGMQLITQSHGYLISTLHHLNPNLYRIRSKGFLIEMLRKLNKMRGTIGDNHRIMRRNLRKGYLSTVTWSKLLIHSRTYLPKGETYRPLGVPRFNWRVFTAMWLTPLNGFYTIGSYQQGFIPHRGTLSSWRQTLNNVLCSQNIYEVDFKGFFPSVNPSMVSLILSQKGMPKSLTDYLLDLGYSYPTRKSIDSRKLEEVAAISRAELDALNLLQGLGPNSKDPSGTFGTKEGFTKNQSGGVTPPSWLWKGEMVTISVNKGNHVRNFRFPWGYQGELLLKYFSKVLHEGPESLHEGLSMLGYSTNDLENPELVWSTLYELFQLDAAMEESTSAQATSESSDPTSACDELFYMQDKGLFNRILIWVKSHIGNTELESLLAPYGKNLSDALNGNNLSDALKYHFHNCGNFETFMNSLKFLRATPDIINLCINYDYVTPKNDKSYKVTRPTATGNEAFGPHDTIHKALVSEPGNDAPYKIIREKFVPGLPQGSPLSPFLSIILLDYAYQDLRHSYPSVHWNFYADDGMFHSNNTEEFKLFLESLPERLNKFGIVIAASKSKVSRLNGEWLEPRIKFLGIVYEPQTGKLYSETRSGRHLLFTFEHLVRRTRSLEYQKEAFPHMIRYYMESLNDSRSYLAYMASLGLLGTYQVSQSYSRRRQYRRLVSAGAIKLATASLRENLGWAPRRAMYHFIRMSKGLLQNFRILPPNVEIAFDIRDAFSHTFGGLIQARMYGGKKSSGGFNTDSGSQDFSLSSVKGKRDKYNGSLGQILHSKLGNHMNVRNGSSYGTHELLLLSLYTCGKRPNHKILSKGPVTRNLEKAISSEKAYLKGPVTQKPYSR